MHRNKWHRIWISLSLFALLLGCGSQDGSMKNAAEQAAPAADSAASENKAPESSSGYSGGKETQKNQTQRKIIKQAEIHQKVTELDPAMQKVQQLVDRSGGFIQSSSIQQLSDSLREAQYVLRIPQESYLSIVDQLMGIGKNELISQKGEDVTQTYYDNEARIQNLTLQEEAVRKLMNQAQKMEDILKIQQELFRIRGEIEQLKGQNRYLDNLSSLSTIQLSIQEVKPVELAEDSPWTQATEGFLASLAGVGDFFVQLMVFLVSNLPVILFIYLPLGLFIWWIYKRRGNEGKGWLQVKKKKQDDK